MTDRPRDESQDEPTHDDGECWCGSRHRRIGFRHQRVMRTPISTESRELPHE